MTICTIAIHTGWAGEPGSILLGRKDGDGVTIDASAAIGPSDRGGLGIGMEGLWEVSPEVYVGLVSLVKAGETKALLDVVRRAVAGEFVVDLDTAAVLFSTAAKATGALLVGRGSRLLAAIRAVRSRGWRAYTDTSLRGEDGSFIRLCGEFQPQPLERGFPVVWLVDASPDQRDVALSQGGGSALVLESKELDDVFVLSPVKRGGA